MFVKLLLAVISFVKIYVLMLQTSIACFDMTYVGLKSPCREFS